jgi:hypothetical protein
MHPSLRKLLPGLLASLSLISPALAGTTAPIAGTYLCRSGCRITDAAPSVEIHGAAATCMNELGGVYYGRALTRNTISCFNTTGRLSRDGQTLRWDNGMVWTRAPEREHF